MEDESKNRSGLSFKALRYYVRIRGLSYDALKSFLLALVLVFLARSMFVEVYRIPTASMVPTLLPGEWVFVTKWPYGLRVPWSGWFEDDSTFITGPKLPKRGDLVVFTLPRDDGKNFIKRVVGLPGDVISIREGELIINGQSVMRNELEIQKLPYAKEELLNSIKAKHLDSAVLIKETLKQTDSSESVSYNIFYKKENLRFHEMLEKTVPDNHVFLMSDNRNELIDSRFFGFIPSDKILGEVSWIWMSLRPRRGSFSIRWDRIGEAVQ